MYFTSHLTYTLHIKQAKKKRRKKISLQQTNVMMLTEVVVDTRYKRLLRLYRLFVT